LESKANICALQEGDITQKGYVLIQPIIVHTS
jgi:hypothetical protein